MTLEELKASGNILFECISGSRAYGLSSPESDTDIRGVFILPKDQFYAFDYVGQINNDSNDIVYYELRKFMELCASNNPNILELLNTPEECVLYKHPLFNQIDSSLFLSKKCKETFANYAFTQIKKARGLEKKIVNPMNKERKTILDFCFVYQNGSSLTISEFLNEKAWNETNCGLSSIPHMKDCYNLFHNTTLNYSGIMNKDTANEVALSNIPKSESAITVLSFNKDGYSAYCKKYKEYWDWVEKRNESRYETTMSHGKNYDSKNMMHTFRLLQMAKEIAVSKVINVRRENRDELLQIKNGAFSYEDLVTRAEELRIELDHLFQESDLPESNDIRQIEDLLVKIRTDFYSLKS